MSLLQRAARAAVVFFGVLLLTALATFLLLIHPNDKRVVFPDDLGKEPITQFSTRRAALLAGGLAHREDIAATAFEGKRRELMQALPDYARPSSARFVSPYQIYVPLGSYPLKLDAQDGLFIPTGATLTLDPGLRGEHEVRFAAFSPRAGAQLSYGVKGATNPQRLVLTGPADPGFDANAESYKNFLRFFQVDPMHRLASWQPVRQQVNLRADDQLSFTCNGGTYGCVIGEVSLYAAAQGGVPAAAAALTPSSPPSSPPAAALTASSPTSAASRPRNVLVILVDTLRGDAVRAGNAPRMQAFAEASTEFTHALAPGNMTSPSTNALLSCQRPSQLGSLAFAYAVANDVREAYYQQKPQPFPGRLRSAGFDTAMIGNISVISEVYGVGVNYGFSRQIALENKDYDAPMIAREAVRWLADNGDHPFFLYLHFNAPHAPYRPPLRDIFATYPGSSAFASYGNLLRWLYQGEVAITDRYLGRVFDALQTLGLADNTMIVLTADHGDQHNWHHFAGNTAGPNLDGAYFDHGATLLNDEINVPLIVHVPGAKPRRVDDYVSTLDVGPTLMDLTGDHKETGCAGASLAPVVLGTANVDPTRVLGSEGFRGRAIVFGGRYKYIRTYEPTEKRLYGNSLFGGDMSLFMAPEQLFDLRLDAAEEIDIGSEQPQLLGQARQLYRDLYKISDAYELVVETPTPQPLSVDLPAASQVQFEEGDGKILALPPGGPPGMHVEAPARERYLIELHSDGATVPSVILGGKRLPVEMTSLRLPLALHPAQLPAEMGGRYTLLQQARTPTAYMRKVEDDGQKNRQIMTGNPAFEKVLREWGYLNDK